MENWSRADQERFDAAFDAVATPAGQCAPATLVITAGQLLSIMVGIEMHRLWERRVLSDLTVARPLGILHAVDAAPRAG
jgi:hypothetical protein